jgi:hypothetical protein
MQDPPAHGRDDDGLDGYLAGVEKEAVGPSSVIVQFDAWGQIIRVLAAGGHKAKREGQNIKNTLIRLD